MRTHIVLFFLFNIFFVYSQNSFDEVCKKLQFDTIRFQKIKKLNSKYAIFTNSKYKEGVIDSTGNIIINDFYQNINCVDSKYFFSYNNCQSSVFNLKGEILFENYEQVEYLKNDLFLMKIDGKHGIISSNKEILFPFEYEIFNYERRILFANHGNKSGILDLKNKKFIPSEFYIKATIIPFYSHTFNDPIIVFNGDKYGIINEYQEIIIPLIYDEVIYPLNKIIAVKYNGKYGVIDKMNNVIKPFIFDKIAIIKSGYRLFNNTKSEYVYDETMQ
jgi:hypothetical protein